jgi:hypothetical protein
MPEAKRFVWVAVAILALEGTPARAQRADGGADGSHPDAAIGPAVEQDEETELPAGHPPVNTTAGDDAGGGMPGVFRPPEDVEHEDPSLPPGSIAVELRDPDDKPLERELVTLGILINSVAKGDSRKHLQLPTNAEGRVVFGDLEAASNIAYRVSAGYQGGAFAATPFQLAQGKAMHVVLHVYPVTHEGALVFSQVAIAAELRDDRIQLEEAITVFNIGRSAWQPEGVQIALPAGFTAFGAQASMSDQGVDEVEGAAKLRGTFPPGQHVVDFRWQLPWSGDKDVDFDVGVPPHTIAARVVMPASGSVKLVASGFSPAEVRRDARGQSFLVAERAMRPGEPRLASVTVGIHDLPTPGPGSRIATGLAAIGVFVGLSRVRRKRTPQAVSHEQVAARQRYLEELAALEGAHLAGEVGPRTYERTRRELIDSLALTLVKP